MDYSQSYQFKELAFTDKQDTVFIEDYYAWVCADFRAEPFNEPGGYDTTEEGTLICKCSMTLYNT